MITRTSQPASGALLISEMKEFASFSKATQRYIRRSLDVAYGRRDAIECWARDEARPLDPRPGPDLQAARPSAPAGSRRQRPRHDRAVHRHADHPCGVRPRPGPPAELRRLPLPLRAPDRRSSRPWLPAAFCAAAALPHLHPDRRRTLLQSISESAATAPGWSSREPVFWPEWVEKVDLQAAA